MRVSKLFGLFLLAVLAAIAYGPLAASGKQVSQVHEGVGGAFRRDLAHQRGAQEIPRTRRCRAMAFLDAHGRAETANSEGNSLFVGKRYDEALVRYTEAVDLVENHAQRDPEAEPPLCKYLCNRAAAYLGAGYHSEALKDCDLALSLDPSLDKALLRRALAREALCKHKEALVDVQQLLGRTQFGSALHTRALDLKRRLDRLVWQEDHTLQTNQAAHLFTSEQTLRLNFRTPPPGAVALGDYFEVSVFVANEFGLFGSKQFEAQHEPVQLQVTAICPGVKTLRVETRGCFDIVLDSHGRASFYLRFLVDGDSQVECGNSDDREGAEWHGAGGEAASASVCVGLREGHTVTSRGVVPVASLPIRLLQEGAGCDPFSAGMAGCWSGRPVAVHGVDTPIIILECPDHGIPGKVWDGGFILSEFLSLHPESVRNRRCVEVGAGTGVVGLTAACLGCAHVTLTDLADHVSILEANILTNARTISAARHRGGLVDASLESGKEEEHLGAVGSGCDSPSRGSRQGACAVVEARSLKWGRADEGEVERVSVLGDADRLGGGEHDWIGSGCDVVLGSDIVYEPKCFTALAETLCNLLAAPGSKAYIAHRPRHPDEHLFWEQVRRDFQVVDTCFSSKAYPHVTDVTVFELIRL